MFENHSQARSPDGVPEALESAVGLAGQGAISVEFTVQDIGDCAAGLG
jgi:hypothetical protein